MPTIMYLAVRSITAERAVSELLVRHAAGQAERPNLNPLRSFGFLLRDTTSRYVERFEQRAGALGLTLPQCKVLVYLADREGISQAQLAELTVLEPMTLVRTLDYLESHGLSERRSDPADRRARRLYLKPKGKALVVDIWHLVDLTRREAFAGIPRKHVNLVIELLEKIQNNFISLEPLQPMPAEPALQSGRVNTGAVRRRRERTALRS
jgi:MarR family transcriptional regulator for hemolysin